MQAISILAINGTVTVNKKEGLASQEQGILNITRTSPRTSPRLSFWLFYLSPPQMTAAVNLSGH